MDLVNKCNSCGAELSPEAKFCRKCGTPVTTQQQSEATAPQMTSQTTQQEQQQEAQNTGYTPYSATNGTSFGESFSNLTNTIFAKTSKRCNTLVRRYFLGFGDIRFLSLLLIIYNLFRNVQKTTFVRGNGGFNLFIAFVFALVFLFFVFFGIYMIFTGSTKVDAATSQAVDYLKKRAFEKFYMDEDQMKVIDPIVVLGPGVSPNGLKDGSVVNYARGKKYFNFLTKISKYFTKDPIEAYKVGSDDALRYLLLQVTVYTFADDQMLVYTGNIDISTGMVYEESVSEIFYNDINAVKRGEVLKKRWSWRRFRHLYYTMQALELDVQGIMNVGAIDMRFTNDDVNRSIVGMEQLVRERKQQ